MGYPRTFVIQQGERVESVEGRGAAVRTARRWSEKRRHRRVHLEREDHKMKMDFRRGELETFILELR